MPGSENSIRFAVKLTMDMEKYNMKGQIKYINHDSIQQIVNLQSSFY